MEEPTELRSTEMQEGLVDALAGSVIVKKNLPRNHVIRIVRFDERRQTSEKKWPEPLRFSTYRLILTTLIQFSKEVCRA